VNRAASGVTLIELLCCLAIVAVLTACAVPLHREAMQRVRRADAREALLNLQTLEERYFFEHGRYAASLAQLGAADDLARSPQQLYRIGVEARDGDRGYVARATAEPDAVQARDADCRMLWLDDRGSRSAAGAADAPRRCWN